MCAKEREELAEADKWWSLSELRERKARVNQPF